MDTQELEYFLGDLESDRVERKASLADKDKICEAICAFANDLPNHQQPGVLFIGVNDDGSCAGLPINDKLLLALSELRSNGNILPFPMMTVQKHMLQGCEIAVITVSPSDAPPIRFRGRTWIRVGPRRAVATQEEERRLAEKRRANDLPFDIHPVWSATIDDLDTDLFRRVYLASSLPLDILAENHRSIEQQLMSMRFISTKHPPMPTVVGILVIGKDPLQFIPGAYIQFVRFDGTELTDPIKAQRSISGSLSEMLNQLDETFEAHISVASNITSQAQEIRSPDYPIAALQQLARNAVLHRVYEGTNAPVRIYWYSDRIEILSPGGPFGHVTSANFGEPGVTDYRNPHLAEAMRNLGYVQHFGVGIQIARRELTKNGNPPLEFPNNENSYMLAIIRKKQ